MQSLEPVYRELLSAAAGEVSFDSLVETAMGHLGAGGGVVFEMNRETGRILDWATPNLVIGDDGYNEHLNSINPRMRFSLRHAAGHVAYEGRFISERAMDRHEFYDWLGSFAKFRYMLGSRVYDDGDISLFCSVEFSRQHGHPETDKIEAFRRLAPALGNAWRLRKRAHATETGFGAATWLPDHLPWSIFALSAAGAVTGMNASARATLAGGNAVELVDGTLRAIDRRSVRGFRETLQSALAGDAAETLLETGSAGPPLIVQALPVDPHGLVGATQVAALVYVKNPLDTSRNIGEVLGRLYGFTLAEQRLADLLAAGADLTIAAGQLRLSRNTVRNRMQSMYAKSGTRRQNEFLVKVLGLLDP